jgi:hypothetical protein
MIAPCMRTFILESRGCFVPRKLDISIQSLRHLPSLEYLPVCPALKRDDICCLFSLVFMFLWYCLFSFLAFWGLHYCSRLLFRKMELFKSHDCWKEHHKVCIRSVVAEICRWDELHGTLFSSSSHYHLPSLGLSILN